MRVPRLFPGAEPPVELPVRGAIHEAAGRCLPVITSPNGTRVRLAETGAYWIDGLIESAADRRLPAPPGRLRAILNTFGGGRADRDWVAYPVGRPEEGGKGWVYVARAKPGSWKDMLSPVVRRLLQITRCTGAVVLEEVSRGRSPTIEGIGPAIPLPCRRHWSVEPGAGPFTRMPLPPELPDPERFRAVLANGAARQARLLRRWLGALETAWERWPPALLLLVNDLEPIRRSTALLFRMRGIPVVNLQHGMINDTPLFRLGISDLHLLWGESFARILARVGIPPERLVPVGAPHYDTIARQPVAPLPAGRIRLLYASQPPSFEIPDETGRTLMQAHIRLARQRPDLDVIVRLHPREPAALREQIARSCADLPNLTVDRSADIVEALAGCTVASLVFSTVSLDALACRRPSVILDFAGCGHRFPFERTPPFFAAATEDALYDTAFRAARWAGSPEAEAGFQAAIDEHLCGCDGLASERAAAAIARLMEDRCRA